MTINELRSELNKLNRSFKTLIKDPTIWNFGEFSSDVRKTLKSADDCFLADELYDVMNSIEDASNVLDYLSKRIVGEFTLYKNSNGRYECELHEYTCGDGIEYYCYDEYDEKYKWVRSRIEYNSDIEDYYIVGTRHLVSLTGLKVRIRK